MGFKRRSPAYFTECGRDQLRYEAAKSSSRVEVLRMATARPETTEVGVVTMHLGAMIRYMVTDDDGHKWTFSEYVRANDKGVVSMAGTIHEELHGGLAKYILVQRSGSF